MDTPMAAVVRGEYQQRVVQAAFTLELVDDLLRHPVDAEHLAAVSRHGPTVRQGAGKARQILNESRLVGDVLLVVARWLVARKSVAARVIPESRHGSIGGVQVVDRQHCKD